MVWRMASRPGRMVRTSPVLCSIAFWACSCSSNYAGDLIKKRPNKLSKLIILRTIAEKAIEARMAAETPFEGLIREV